MRSVFSLSMNAMSYLLAVLLVGGLSGCRERDNTLPSAPVTGVVVYNGKPLGFGRIMFVHDSGHTTGADLAADGRFLLTAYQGTNRVAVECLEVDRPGSNKSRSRAGNDKSLIPSQYANYSTSRLTFEVNESDNTAEFILR